jgi:hypothetical protein
MLSPDLHPLVNLICPVREELILINYTERRVFYSHWTHWSGMGREYKGVVLLGCYEKSKIV